MPYPRFTENKFIVYIFDNFIDTVDEKGTKTATENLENFFDTICNNSVVNVINLAFANPDVNTLNIIGDDGSIMEQWMELTDDQKKYIKDKYFTKNNKKILCSWGGSGKGGALIGAIRNIVLSSLAKKMVDFCLDNLFDGIDIDYEGTDATVFGELGTEIRKLNDDILLTYAPEADNLNSLGFYKVAKTLGDGLDWYNIQYYNSPNGITSEQMFFVM